MNTDQENTNIDMMGTNSNSIQPSSVLPGNLFTLTNQQNSITVPSKEESTLIPPNTDIQHIRE